MSIQDELKKILKELLEATVAAVSFILHTLAEFFTPEHAQQSAVPSQYYQQALALEVRSYVASACSNLALPLLMPVRSIGDVYFQEWRVLPDQMLVRLLINKRSFEYDVDIAAESMCAQINQALDLGVKRTCPFPYDFRVAQISDFHAAAELTVLISIPGIRPGERI